MNTCDSCNECKGFTDMRHFLPISADINTYPANVENMVSS